MKFDFPEESLAVNSTDQTDANEELAINLPPIFATVAQLEEINRNLTASCLALATLLKKSGQITADDFNTAKQEMLNHLDAEFARRLAAKAGPDRQKQIEYLQNNPLMILSSGAYIK